MTLTEFEKYVKPKAGVALVVGSRMYKSRPDRRLLFSSAIGVDLSLGSGVDRVLDLEEPLPANFGPFAHVDCVSVLEHSKRPWLLAANIERLLEPDGTLYITVPFVWRVHSYPSDYWRFSPEAVRLLFPSIKWAALNFVTGLPGLVDRVPNITHDGHAYFARTETCGFGMLRSVSERM